MSDPAADTPDVISAADYERFTAWLKVWQNETKHDPNTPVHVLQGWMYRKQREACVQPA